MIQNNKNIIHIILTGGRIDSVWDGNLDEIVVNNHSLIPQYFNSTNVSGNFIFSEVCMKDSRALTEEDRKKLLKIIEESTANNIFITHGTHTLPDTMRYLKTHLKRTDQTIVFTGAITPLKDFAFSDAAFNLGFGLAKVEELKTGIYLCIFGKTLHLDDIEKDIQDGNFYSYFRFKQ